MTGLALFWSLLSAGSFARSAAIRASDQSQYDPIFCGLGVLFAALAAGYLMLAQ